MTISSQPEQAAQPRLILNPVVWVNGRKWWLPLEDLELFDRWLTARGFRRAHARPVYRGRGRVSRTYRDAAGDVVTVSLGGLVGTTGQARRLLEALPACERVRTRAGWTVHAIAAQRSVGAADETQVE